MHGGEQDYELESGREALDKDFRKESRHAVGRTENELQPAPEVFTAIRAVERNEQKEDTADEKCCAQGLHRLRVAETLPFYASDLKVDCG